jgi:N-acetylmuramoyl-L-alanine amidase
MRFRELLLTPNKYSRPGTPMPAVLAVVMHWTEAYGWSAEAIREYFESLKSGVEGRSASAHYAVDEDEAIMMVPTTEVAYHCGSGSDFPIGYTQYAVDRFHDYPNKYTIGIEMCIRNDGEFDPRTIDNARMIAAMACTRHDLRPSLQIVRHYDITGKECPRAWVRQPAELEAFRKAVASTMAGARERGGMA